MSAVLVVGASGILSPAAVRLVAKGHGVTGIGRTRPMPSGVEPFLVDARQERALHDAVGAQRWDLAVVYSPAVSEPSLRVIRSAVVGRVLLVRTTAAVASGSALITLPPGTLQLGWHVDPDGSTRWHTPEEVSAAALTVLADGGAGVLGTLQPWGSRP